MMKSLIAATVLLGAGAAQALTYDAVAGFGSGPFSYGQGSFGAGFVALPDFAADGCVGVTGLTCYNNSAGQYTFPAIGKNISASDPLVFYTNFLPKDQLFVQTLPGTQAILRFTAPVTSTYSFSATFTRIDKPSGNGDGVTVGVFDGTTANSFGLGTTYLSSAGFGGTVALAAGSSIDFYLDANGDTNNDGTGLVASISVVPEPATWGLMLAGFAGVGFAARRRRIAVSA